MSEIDEFVKTVETPEQEVPEQQLTEVDAQETATEPHKEPDQESEPTSQDEPEKTDKVPIVALLNEREKRQERDRQIEQQQRELEQLRQQMAEASKPKPESQAEFPTLDKFEYDEAKYQQAVAEYMSSQMNQQAEGLKSSLKQEWERDRLQQEAMAKRDDFINRGRKVAPDFDSVVLADVPITEAMAEVAMNLDHGAEVIYALAKTPAELERISKMSPYLQAVELGRRNDMLAKPATPEPKPVPDISPSLTDTRAAGRNNEVVMPADPLETTFNR